MAADVPSAQDVSRVAQEGAAQSNQGAVNLALLEAENTQAAAGAPTSGGSQDTHPSVQRLSSPAWAGFTGQLNGAQAAAEDADVWVTVPVDKVVTTPTGAAGIAPVYASTKGYRARPGESVGSIPPPTAVRRG